MFASVTDVLTDGMYQISSLLLLPVILVVIALFLWTILLAGGFLREWLERRRVRSGLSQLVIAAHAAPPKKEDLWVRLKTIPSGIPAVFTSRSRVAPSDSSVIQKYLRSRCRYRQRNCSTDILSSNRPDAWSDGDTDSTRSSTYGTGHR